MVVEDLFSIIGRGTVFAGRVEGAPLSVGDSIVVKTPSREIRTTVIGIEMVRKTVTRAEVGVDVGVLCRSIANDAFSDCYAGEGEDRRVHGLVLATASPTGKRWWEFWRT
jgi:translation elongation factor EF-Tu-like GTPase